MSLSSSCPPVPAPRPYPGWPTRSTFHALERITDAEHLVQLYETEPYLVACAARFLRDPLRAGGGVLVIATPEHREAIEAALDLEEICVGAASRHGRYFALDAQWTLESVTPEGRPDAAAFRRLVGNRLAGLSRRWHDVRVYGEMGSLLWQEGRHAEATALERDWSAARRRHRFVRLSAYPACGLSDDFAGAALARLCAENVRVLPPQRSIGPDALRALRAPRAAALPGTRRRSSRGSGEPRRKEGRRAASR